MKVYFEDVKFYHYPLLKHYISHKFHIYLFDFRFNARSRKWLRDLIDDNKISIISPYIIGSGSLALDNIEKLYSYIAKDSRLIDSMVQFYNETNITLAYKKILVKDLSDFYAVQITLEREANTIGDNESIIFIPSKYLEMQNFLNRCLGFTYNSHKISIPLWIKWITYIIRFFSRVGRQIFFWFINFGLVIIVTLKILLPSRKKELCKYQYAIAITNPDFQFKFKEYRTFDFLLDQKNIGKENSIFLFTSPINKVILSTLKQDGYNVAVCDNKSILVSPEFHLRKNRGPILKKLLVYIIKNFAASLAAKDSILLCDSILLFTYVKWNLILDNIRFKHHITFDDQAINHIGRNILLSHFGCKTWHYAHTACFAYTRTNENIDILIRRGWVDSFLWP